VKESELEKMQEKLERDLDLVGRTAIEDKLQEEVGATILFMKTAGIKVRGPHGDKIETAINVGYSLRAALQGYDEVLPHLARTLCSSTSSSARSSNFSRQARARPTPRSSSRARRSPRSPRTRPSSRSSSS